MNGEAPAARYLPPHVADGLRQTMAGVGDARARAEIVTLVEETYATGYADGYGRAYGDGAAEREATMSSADMLLTQTRLEIGGQRVNAP